MLGDSVKLNQLATKLDQNVTEYYYPKETWCDIFNTKGVEGCVKYENATWKNESSKAYDFGLQFRTGSIIPFQNETKLRLAAEGDPNKNYTTVKAFQEEPTDFLVHMYCNSDQSKACNGIGYLINDNGESTNYTHEINRYTVNMNYQEGPVGIHMIMSFQMDHNATAHDKGVINQNDILGDIAFYNAMDIGLTGDVGWDCGITYVDGSTKPCPNGYYDAYTDRLVYKGINEPMPMLSQLFMSKR